MPFPDNDLVHAINNVFGAIPQTAVQQSVGFTGVTGTSLRRRATFTGNVGSTAYTIGEVAPPLKTLGLIKT